MPTTTKFIWDEDNYLAEADATNTINVMYTNEPQQDGNLVSTRIAGTTSYYHFDALGSTRQMTKSAGTVTDTTINDASGNVIARTGSTRSNLQWNGALGYYFDVETGMQYVRSRIYGSAIGRWSSEDRSGHIDGLNQFLYARNNPINMVDPTGNISTVISSPQWAIDKCKADCKAKKLRFLKTITVRHDFVILGIACGFQSTLCVCLDECIFYRLWCDWGAGLPVTDPAKKKGFWPLSRAECAKCYEECRDNSDKWKCKVGGGKRKKQNNVEYDGENSVLPDDWEDLLP